jgi:serine/threonine-protein phosphatase 2A regulatory subunit B
VLTGSYNNYFQIFNWRDPASESTLLQADKSIFKVKKAAVPAKNRAAARKAKRDHFQEMDTPDFVKKIMHASWHPRENNLFLFHADKFDK